jgi:hypothetical protein
VVIFGSSLIESSPCLPESRRLGAESAETDASKARIPELFLPPFPVQKCFITRSPLEKVSKSTDGTDDLQFTQEKWYKDETESNFDDCQFVTNSVEFQSKSTISMKGASAFSRSS